MSTILKVKAKHFKAYNVSVTLETNSSLLLREMKRYYSTYLSVRKAPSYHGTIVVIETDIFPRDFIPKNAVCDFYLSSYSVYVLPDDKNRIFYEIKNRYLISVDYAKNEVRCFAKSAENIVLQIKFTMKMMFDILLEEKGLFPIHCSGVVNGGKTVLFCGNTHSGKTTAALSCLESGYRLFSEDRVLFRPSGELLPFYTRSRVDKRMFLNFPGLKNRLKFLDPSHYFEKTKGWYVDLGKAFFAKKSELGPKLPSTLVFLNFHNSDDSVCKKISGKEALARLKEGHLREIGNSLWWMMDKDNRIKKVENAYRKLVAGSKAKCYRFLIGRDHNKFSSLMKEVCGVG
ncbi:MAG: hypothetical protein KKD29_07840 [Candidatus Omnitrophica bacterium]|nr:hypothetical protein [Candidatus Omnitrophota bacterium]MBU4488710.1 hypothetical protein [Candidatus Omnitrophota bacterium]MCG2705739.1 hypothetical protein [Candidatus Omnitrophota bacterium]